MYSHGYDLEHNIVNADIVSVGPAIAIPLRQTMKKTASTVTLLLCSAFAHGQEGHSIYFAGLTQHIKPGAKTREGNMELLGYSMLFKKDDWRLEPGVNTYVDSYSQRSYTAFVDISNDNYAYAYFRPVLSISCMHKGTSYDSDQMATECWPLLKLRVGGPTKLFANVIPVPSTGGRTNGFVALEVGYNW